MAAVTPRSCVTTLLALLLAALAAAATAAAQPVPGTRAPEISGAPWINSAPLTLADLRGRVVLVEFWTYG
jgi:ABC-type nitrate/sulfonate/bicarbonate transport system substrate-binding protein